MPCFLSVQEIGLPFIKTTKLPHLDEVPTTISIHIEEEGEVAFAKDRFSEALQELSARTPDLCFLMLPSLSRPTLAKFNYLAMPMATPLYSFT